MLRMGPQSRLSAGPRPHLAMLSTFSASHLSACGIALGLRPQSCLSVGAPTPPTTFRLITFSDREDFFFLLRDHLVDGFASSGDLFFGFLFGAFDFVFARVAAAFELAEHVERVVSRFANAHLALLTVLLRDLHEILA